MVLLSTVFASYLPLFLFLALAALLVAGLILISRLIGQRTHNPTKDSPYECGNIPTGSSRQRFTVKFYLVAVLFILFDVESVFLYPWAINLRPLGWFGLSAMAVFLLVLGLGLAYVWRKGALDWN
ncbi:MAG: NADH-quinone oxidoreductase subunit A [Planctomycetota bacterium]